MCNLRYNLKKCLQLYIRNETVGRPCRTAQGRSSHQANESYWLFLLYFHNIYKCNPISEKIIKFSLFSFNLLLFSFHLHIFRPWCIYVCMLCTYWTHLVTCFPRSSFYSNLLNGESYLYMACALIQWTTVSYRIPHTMGLTWNIQKNYLFADIIPSKSLQIIFSDWILNWYILIGTILILIGTF